MAWSYAALGMRKHTRTGGGECHGAHVPGLGTALGVGNTPISKNRRSTGGAPRGQNAALGQEKLYCVLVLCRGHAKARANRRPP